METATRSKITRMGRNNNKKRWDNLLNDEELSDVSIALAYTKFIIYQHEKNNSKATIDFYERFYKKYCAFLNSMKLTEDDSVSWLVIDGMMLGFVSFIKKKDSKTGKEANQQTVNSYLRGYRAFGNYCEEQGLIEGFYCPIKEVAPPIKQVYTDSELKKLTKKPPIENFNDFRTYTIIELILATGARSNTILNIKIEDVDIENGTIAFNVTKTNTPIIIPLQKKAKMALREYIDYWRNTDFENISPDDYLFCNEYEEQLTRSGLASSIRRYNLARGVEKTSIHLFRHTFAKNWIISGGDIISLAKVLTHSELDMVKRYSNLYGMDLKDKIEKHSTLSMLKTNNGKTIKNK